MQRPGGEIEEKTENRSEALQIKEADITCILVEHIIFATICVCSTLRVSYFIEIHQLLWYQYYGAC